MAIVGSVTSSTTQIMISDTPPVTSSDYVVRGRVKYDGVVGDGYLELLNHFGEKGTYFTRTLSSSGAMKKLNGTSDWREFELPFHANSGMKPQRLTLNIVLPGQGTVTISESVTLSSIKTSTQWWSGPQSGVFGGVAGSALGMLGGLIGLAAWKKSRRLTFGLCLTGILSGCAALISGLIAVGVGQPFSRLLPLTSARVDQSVCDWIQFPEFDTPDSSGRTAPNAGGRCRLTNCPDALGSGQSIVSIESSPAESVVVSGGRI